jgi:hypothetical protein
MVMYEIRNVDLNIDDKQAKICHIDMLIFFVFYSSITFLLYAAV